MAYENILEVEHLSKRFPGVVALDDVELRVKTGTVHALMGENGAGKSTLMKVLNGMYKPDSGVIRFKGEPITIQDTRSAILNGISMIHQELSPIPQMTVAENIFLGREPIGPLGLINYKRLKEMTQELLDRLSIRIDPSVKVVNLSVANIQLIEIAKAISYNADLIIMDEPTSAITEREVEDLFKIIRALRDGGKSIIYITHKMDEVFHIADYVTIFRDGKYIGTDKADSITKQVLIEKMVGRALDEMFYKEKTKVGEVMLEARNLTKTGQFEDVSFKVHRGEILGISGLMGAGRTELLENVFGITSRESGAVLVKGKEVRIKSPADAIRHGMALLTEDRKLTGLYQMLSVRDNMYIANIRSYIRLLSLDFKKIRMDCESQVRKLRIKTPSLQQTIRNLSGGNQQKVLISRWLLTDPEILILDEPTRGIDVGAKAEIHRLMTELAKAGKAIIMISSELPEILGMSDRILVMHEGRKTGELAREEATQEKIMNLATGEVEAIAANGQ